MKFRNCLLLLSLIPIASVWAQETLALECSFQRITTDTIEVYNGKENKRESFSVDAKSGAVNDGGVAHFVTKSANAKTSASENKFAGFGSGDLTENLSLQFGSYEIDRYTGTYSAKVMLTMKTIFGPRVSQIDETGICKNAKKQF